ncbi:hypothetical protein ACOSQ4_017268 [Xanthoceras sorbifolium]
MQRSLTSLVRPHVARRRFSTSSKKIVASLLFERLPVVIPKIDPKIRVISSDFKKVDNLGNDEFLDKSNSRNSSSSLK